MPPSLRRGRRIFSWRLHRSLGSRVDGEQAANTHTALDGFEDPVDFRVGGACRDGDVRDIRSAAMRARAAYGPKDSVRDALPASLTEPFLDAVDRLLKAIARYDLQSDR